MTGHYFECDSCHRRTFGDTPEPGWIGMTRVLSAAPRPSNPFEAELPGRGGVDVDEHHVCSVSCAINILTPLPAGAVVQ